MSRNLEATAWQREPFNAPYELDVQVLVKRQVILALESGPRLNGLRAANQLISDPTTASRRIPVRFRFQLAVLAAQGPESEFRTANSFADTGRG